MYGKQHSEKTKNKISKSKLGCSGLSGNANPMWKGGYYSKKIPTYDGYVSRLEPYEQCKRNNDDPNVLEVKCTYCGKWYTPTIHSIVHRIYQGINYNDILRLYCSKSCKQECPLYRQQKQYKGNQGYYSREVQPQLRQMVFERDNCTCQKCGNIESLHCHHIDPVVNNPIESADINNCITLCKDCHKEVHQQSGCGYVELRKCA
jgi:5-methylcytosine-specific restriction enzyme A